MFGAIGKAIGGMAKKKFGAMKEQPGLLKGISDFKSWNQQRKAGGPGQAPGGARPGAGMPQGGPGGFRPPQLPGSQMTAPQIGQPMPQPQPSFQAPQLGGAEPNPWATQPPQPPKPTGGQWPGLQGRGGFIPGGMGRGTGSMGGGFDF